jgi:hypothetical protein
VGKYFFPPTRNVGLPERSGHVSIFFHLIHFLCYEDKQ